MTESRTPRAIVAITGAALFMIVLDNLIVLSTLPSIERSLHASLASLEWVVDAYILAFAVLMLSAATLGERYGRRRVFVAGVLLFTAASAAGGFAPSAGVLIAARVVQGVGAAVVMPLTLTLLTAAFPVERRPAALGMWSAIAGLGIALGPIAGGLLTDALSWHWIFWVNVPVGLAVVAAAPRILTAEPGRHQPIDQVGLLLSATGLLGVVWATVRGNAAGWTSAQTLGAYAIGILLLAAFVRWELRSASPMLPMRLFSSRRFSIANASAFALHFAMFGTFYLVIEFLSSVRHESPVMSGVWTLPWTVMPLFVSPLAGRLARRVAPAALAATGLGLVAAGITAMAVVLGPGTPPIALAVPLWSIGTGIGLTLPSIVGLAMSAAPPADLGSASGTLNTARQLGSVFGIAVPVAIFAAKGSGADAAGVSDGIAAALIATAAAAAIGSALLATLAPQAAWARAAVARRLSIGRA